MTQNTKRTDIEAKGSNRLGATLKRRFGVIPTLVIMTIVGIIIFAFGSIIYAFVHMALSTNTNITTASRTPLQEAYMAAILTEDDIPISQTKFEYNDGGMIQVSDDGRVITVRMPYDSNAHRKDWLGMVARIIVRITNTDGEAAIEKLQSISVNHLLDFQKAQDTNDYISEFVGQIKLTDKISSVIGVMAGDEYPFMYFAFYDEDADLLSVASDVCTGFYARNMFWANLQLLRKNASSRYYTREALDGLFVISDKRFSSSPENGTMTLVGNGVNQQSLLRGESITDNLISCAFATMGIPSNTLRIMTNDRKNNWKSGTYSWGDYKLDVKYIKDGKSYIPYYTFSKKK